MKKLLITVAGTTALFLGGCKEVPPIINFRTTAATDTTYVVTPVPTAQLHNVLVEEYTGESCSNCPAAHDRLDADVTAHPGRVIIVSMYPNSNASISVPPTGAAFDLRDSVVSQIMGSTAYTTNADANYSNLPGAGVDRVPLTSGTSTYLPASAWDGLITSRLATPDSVNLDITSSYDASSGIDTIIATITYTQAVSTPQNLSIIMVEDSIIDYQEFPFGVLEPHYVFNDVFIGMVTAAPFGDAILSTMATKEAGRVYRRKYLYHVPMSHRVGAVNPAHCKVIGFVNRPSGSSPNFEVMQSQQVKL